MANPSLKWNEQKRIQGFILNAETQKIMDSNLQKRVVITTESFLRHLHDEIRVKLNNHCHKKFCVHRILYERKKDLIKKRICKYVNFDVRR